MLTVRHFTTGYGRRQVLADISLEVGEGEIVLLVGGNGSGKSTVIKSIYGLLRPWANEGGGMGSIRFRGKDITGIPTSDLLRLGMAYMPQKKNVFDNFTVEENLLVAASIYSKNETRRRIETVYMDIPKLVELRHRYPFSMSGGERQLLAFGCVLLHSPKLMLLDEPCAGVDAENTSLLLKKIAFLRKSGVAFIIVEHNSLLFEPIEYRMIELNLGKIKI